jgi:hypothetical protein
MMPGCAQRNIPGEPTGGADSSTCLPMFFDMQVTQKFLSGTPQTVVAMRPPGLSTRAISLAACCMSGKNM